MAERSFQCSSCGIEHSQDSCGKLDALMLVDEREQIATTLAVWCNEECLAAWIASNVFQLLRNELRRRIHDAQAE